MSGYAELISRFWPEWQVEERLGKGSYGVVYACKRVDETGAVARSAIKVIRIPKERDEEDPEDEETLPEQSESYLESVVRDLAEEIRLMETMKGNTNIVSIEDYLIRRLPEEKARVILVRMELLTPLRKYMAQRPMDEREVIRLGEDLCTALDVCRKNRIIHRDIKPDNICVNRNGDFKLGDFGEARVLENLTMSLTRRGTPNYMSPELYHHSAGFSDIQSGSLMDLYSLGLVMYWLMNDRRLPFMPEGMITPRSELEAFTRRINGEEMPPPCHASEDLSKVILKACAMKPEDRYQSPAQMKEALSSVKEAGRERTGGDRTKRKWWKPAVIAGALALILAAGIWMGWSGLFQNDGPGKDGKDAFGKQVSAADPVPYAGDYEFSILPDGTVQIDRYDGPGGNLTIPGEYDGRKITVIGDNVFYRNNGLTSVVIPEGVTKINRFAFAKCSRLAMVFVPNSVKEIGEKAFLDCGEGFHAVAVTGSYAEKYFIDNDIAYMRAPVQVGQSLFYGHYPNNTDDSLIEWLVLDVDRINHKALLISRSALDCRSYNDTDGDTTWENCSLRAWLNSAFISEAFTSWEQSAVLDTMVDNGASQCSGEWETVGGNDTQDRLFLLSCSEALAYFGTDRDRICGPTEYAVRQGTFSGMDTDAVYWYLRSPGLYQNNTACVDRDGTISFNVSVGSFSIRPAMWVRLDESDMDIQPVIDPAGIAVGDIVPFGHYPQTASGMDHSPIEWLVLETDPEGHKALLLSLFGLDAKPYHEEYDNVSWEKCSLRTWLNSEFFREAFSAAEQEAVLTTEVGNSENQGYDWASLNYINTDGGNDTRDRVFLLSFREASRYFDVEYNSIEGSTENTAPRMLLTPYAIARKAFYNKAAALTERRSMGRWWLRSPGLDRSDAAFVDFNGSMFSYHVDESSISVRPAIWIDLEPEVFLSEGRVEDRPGKTDTITYDKNSDNDGSQVILQVGERTLARREAEYQVLEFQQRYSLYWQYGLFSDIPDAQELLEDVIASNIERFVLLNKAEQIDELKLTEEELAAVTETAQKNYDQMIDSVASGYITGGASGDALREEAVAYAESHGFGTLDDYITAAKEEKLLEKITDYTHRDVTVTEEELQARLDELADANRTAYDADPAACGTAINNGTPVYYVPEGYRYVKHILIRFTGEDAAAVSAASAARSTAKTAADSAAAALDRAKSALDNAAGDADKTALQAAVDRAQAALDAANADLENANAAYDSAVAAAAANIQAKADEVYALVTKEGADFDALADEYGEDPGMKRAPVMTNGYALCAASAFLPEFLEASLALENAGDISGEVVTEYGIHIIKYEGDIPAGPVALDSVREVLTMILTTEKEKAAYATALEEWMAEYDIRSYPEKIDY